MSDWLLLNGPPIHIDWLRQMRVHVNEESRMHTHFTHRLIRPNLPSFQAVEEIGMRLGLLLA
jgi:hypothetical protein